MKQTLTRLLALTLCLCLVLPFAGCGNSEEPVEQPESSDVSTDATESTEYVDPSEYTEDTLYEDPSMSTEDTLYTDATDYTDPTAETLWGEDTTAGGDTGILPEDTQATTVATQANATTSTQSGVNTTGRTEGAPTKGTTKNTTQAATNGTTKATNGTTQAATVPTYTVPTYTYPTYTVPTYTVGSTQATTKTNGTTAATTKAPTQAATQATTKAPTKAPTNATTKVTTTKAPTQAPTQGTTQATTTHGKKPVVTFTTTTEWTTTTTAAPKNPLRVLSIGHSFSKDAMENYLWDLLDSSGKYDYIVCAYLFYPGCPLDGQWDRINGNIDPETGYPYEYQQYRKTDPYYGSWSTQYKPDNYKNLAAYAIKDEDWDIITIQPSPDYGAGPEVCKGKNDYGHVGDIVNWINKNKTNKKAQIYYHMTWSFAEDCRLWSFMYSNFDQMQMYNDFVNATKKYIFEAHPGKFAGIIPSGTSIQNARSSKLGDVFNMPGNYDANADGYHLNDRGDLVAALTWYCVLTGQSAKTATCPDTTYASEFDIFVEAVDAAIKTPYAVTESSHK